MKAWQFPLIAISFLAFPTLGFTADVKPEQLPVSERPHPEVDPIGVHIGAWMLYPSVTAIESFDNNIYATKNTKKSDLITQLSPQIKLNSLNTERGFNADLSSVHGTYSHHDGENYDDYKASLNPFWKITHALKFIATLSREKGHEQRSDPDALANNASLEPVTYNRTAAKLGWDYKHGRFGVGLAGERAYLDFDNGTAIGGQSLINDDRNRFENNVSADLSCDITDQSTVYWTTNWLNREYKRPDFNTVSGLYDGAERDSNGYQSVIGWRFPLTHTVSLDTNAGYRHQGFDDDATYKDINTAVGKLAFTWLITGLTTVDVAGYRDVFETNQTGASGYVQSNIGSTVSHELRRNVILQANAGAGRNQYIGINRDDDYWTAGAAAIYKMNRHLHWRLAYNFENRDSNIAAASYDKQRIYLSAKVQF